MHCEDSGVTDFFADDDAHALRIVRGVMEHVDEEGLLPEPFQDVDEPMFAADDLLSLAPPTPDASVDMLEIIARLVDGSRFQQFKARYGAAVVTGYGKIGGKTVGIIAAGHGSAVPTAPDFVKASHFVQLCEHRNRPILFLQHANFDETCNSDEVLKSIAQLGAAVASSGVPKITLVLGSAIGYTAQMFGGRSLDPSLFFSWPTAVIGPRDDTVQSSIAASARIHDDEVIDPRNTRTVLRTCFQILSRPDRISAADIAFSVETLKARDTGKGARPFSVFRI